MSRKQNVFDRIWNIAYPVAMYYASITIGIFLAQLIFGTGNESYMLCKIIGSLAALPVVYTDYKNDRAMFGIIDHQAQKKNDSLYNVIMIVVITCCLSVSLNNFICMSPLVTLSDSYQTASDAFYGSSFFLELLGSAVITPFLEELLHRGVVYGRLRRMTGKWTAVLLSAGIFALLHFNIVQFVYAFLLGIVFALFVEKTKKLSTAVLAHVAANGIAVFRTETGFLNHTVDGSVSAWLWSIGLGLIGLGFLLMYEKRSDTIN